MFLNTDYIIPLQESNQVVWLWGDVDTSFITLQKVTSGVIIWGDVLTKYVS